MMSDVLTYQTVDELQALSIEELSALWDFVPTERQRRYKAVYDREVRQSGAVGSDALEQQVAGELLTRYRDTALVPIGARWARTPARIQQAARTSTDLVAPETLEAERLPQKPPVLIMAAAGFAFMIMALLVALRLGGHGKAALTVSITLTQTATPAHSPTPTPIALENQDSVVLGGDGSHAVAYPVNLRVSLPNPHQPRVFVVQRRVINTTEWNFDANPDTASYLANLTVRPILGIPYSGENATLFQGMRDDTVFTLQMNTGATLRFTFDSRTEVSRSDTGIFRQVGPGLVLVLIGERDADGALTATRTVITATYATDQELARDGALVGVLPTLEPTPTPTASATVFPLSQLDVTLVTVSTIPGQITARLRLFNNSDQPVQITPDSMWLALGYAPEPDGPRVPAEGLTPFELMSGQAADITVNWAWAGEIFGSLKVCQFVYTFSLERTT